MYASANAVQRVLRLLSEGAFIDLRTKSLSGLLVTYNSAAEAFAIANLVLARGVQVCPRPSVPLPALILAGLPKPTNANCQFNLFQICTTTTCMLG